MERAFRIAVLCASFAGAALAQGQLEVIALRHSTAEQVIPALRPLLEPGGTLTGQYSQLIVRASPANIAELRRALEAIDRPRRRLVISMRFDESATRSREEIAAGVAIGNRGSNVAIRAQDSQSASGARIEQRVQVLEGGRAFIATGQSRPVRQRQAIQTPVGPVGQDSFVLQEAATGFEVSPRLAGNRVFLDIAPQRERFSSRLPGAVESQRMASSVSGPMGEWFEIGGAVSNALRERSGIGSAASSAAGESRSIQVKVEEAQN